MFRDGTVPLDRREPELDLMQPQCEEYVLVKRHSRMGAQEPFVTARVATTLFGEPTAPEAVAPPVGPVVDVA